MNQPGYGNELLEELIQIVEDETDLARWGFRLSHTKLEKIGSQAFNTMLIYNSDWCRIQFSDHVVFGGIPDSHELQIYYGRLHAPNDTSIMIWNGERCYSWHGDGFTHLYFLDGFSPSETMELLRNDKIPRVIEEFRESDLGKRLRSQRGPRSRIGRENATWNYYRVRLFELFDLRRPDLWEQYTHYLRELDSIKNDEFRINGKKRITSDLPQWKIC